MGTSPDESVIDADPALTIKAPASRLAERLGAKRIDPVQAAAT